MRHIIDDLDRSDIQYAMDTLALDTDDVIDEGYKALARRDYALAMKRKDDGRGISFATSATSPPR